MESFDYKPYEEIIKTYNRFVSFTLRYIYYRTFSGFDETNEFLEDFLVKNTQEIQRYIEKVHDSYIDEQKRHKMMDLLLDKKNE